MKIIGVSTKAIDPIRANTMVGNHIEVPSKGEGDNKIIIEANTKLTVDNLIPPVAATIIIIMAIIEVEVAVAMVETYRPCGHGRGNYQGHNNYQYHLLVMVSIIPLNIVLRESMTSIISWRK